MGDKAQLRGFCGFFFHKGVQTFKKTVTSFFFFSFFRFFNSLLMSRVVAFRILYADVPYAIRCPILVTPFSDAAECLVHTEQRRVSAETGTV